MIKSHFASILLLCSLAVHAAPPSKEDIEACERGQSHGYTKVTYIPFQDLNEEEGYWKGYTATTVNFKGNSLGYAIKGASQGLAYNHRVYPLEKLRVINMIQSNFDDQVKRGNLSIGQPSDWYWLEGRQKFVCVVTNKSMEKATPIMFFLNTGRTKQIYAAIGGKKS